MTFPSRTRTAPTIGLGLASATRRAAKSSTRSMNAPCAAPVEAGSKIEGESMRASIEEGRDERLGVKRHQVFRGLAGADVADRQTQFARDGHDDSALGRAIQLGQDNAGRAGGCGELARLREAILSRGRVHYEQAVARGAG